MIFWLLWGLDALVATIFVFFFVIGLGDGSISSFNIALWLGILVALTVVLGGSLLLRKTKLVAIAYLLLLLLAVPSLGFACVMAVVILSGERMN